ncbi:MAG: hypothetical protein IJP00_02585 [Firmicutes bacterium]|nr:hypothetical protein [Bacillota bacterium]
MRNTLRLNHERNLIIMDRTFAKLAQDTFSDEYKHLQMVRADYPTYRVVRKTIKKNPDKETWKGLTYDYMREYIILHEETDTRKAVMDELDDLILISKCHAQSKRYPVIKNWFLNKYPEIKKFGMPKEETAEVVEKEAGYEVVMPALETAA